MNLRSGPKVLLALLLVAPASLGAASQHLPGAEALARQPPDNCEGNSRRLDMVRNLAEAAGEGEVIIVVARTGSGESRRELSRRRLHTVRTYLVAMGLPPQALVTAEGEGVRGYGRVEVYVAGRLVEALTVGRGGDLRIGDCDNDVEDRRRYQLPRRHLTSAPSGRASQRLSQH